MNQAVFLDRDGVICQEGEYACDPRQLRLIPGAGEAIRLLNTNGLIAIVVTNQSGVARGFFSEASIGAMNRAMEERLAAQGAHLDGIYYCPHHPQGAIAAYRRVCDCRKPATGLLTQAAREHSIDLTRSYLVGDKRSDMECAQRAGAQGILVLTGYGTEESKHLPEAADSKPACIATDLLDAIRWVIKDIRSSKHENSDHQVECDR